MYYYIYCQDVEGWPYVCILGVYVITYTHHTHPLYIITTGYVAYLVTYVITYIYQIYTYAL